MLIAIDYDDTFTRDPSGWREVMQLMEARGHRFVCITGRALPPGDHEPEIPCRVICTDGNAKRRFAQALGLMVDVWIDDVPEVIGISAAAQLWPDEEEPS